MESGTNLFDVALWTPDEREQIAWKTAKEVHELVLTGFSVASNVGWVSIIEESGS
jgi:hypothetical protein